MMTNMFSMFDPCNFHLKMSWMITITILISPILMMYSKLNSIMKKISSTLSMEFNVLTNSNLSNNFIMPLFMMVLMVNLMSMIPSTFAPSAQMSTIMPMALSMWMANIIFFTMKKTNKMFTHMAPMGAPFSLMPFMIMIETISNLIRPITLSVRLMANITAGHLLMHLLSSFICSMSMKMTLIMIPMSLILNFLEMGVALIQSYILCTLITLYSNEIH